MLIDLSRPVVYRLIDLNDSVIVGDRLVGTSIARVSMGGVSGVGYTEKRAGSDGLTASDVFQAGRVVSIEGVTYGASRGDLSDRLQNIVAAMTPRSAYVESPGDKGFLPLQFFCPTARVSNMVIDGDTVAQWIGGEIECFVKARPKAQPQFYIDRDSSGGDDDDPLAMRWSVAFDCIDPRIYIAPRIDTPFTTLIAGAGSATYDLYNRGTYPAPLNFLFVVPANSGTAVITIAGAGTAMTLTVPTATQDRTVRVSTNDQIVTSQLGTDEQTLAMSYVTHVVNRVWPYIQPYGHVSLGVTTDKQLGAGSLVWYYEALA